MAARPRGSRHIGVDGPDIRPRDAYHDDTLSTQTSPFRVRETGELQTRDVFALIVNKMIRTGVFTAPASVYLITGHKFLSLGLWFVGFAYCLVSTILYLDYAAALPYTGGELIYTEEMTAHSGPHTMGTEQTKPSAFVRGMRRVLGDGLLAYVVYSILFVLIFNSGTNTAHLGRMIHLAYIADQTSENGGTPDVNMDFVRFAGIVALSVLCLIQWASPRFGRKLNVLWALIKIGFVLAVIISGGVYLANHEEEINKTSRRERWFKWEHQATVDNVAKALLQVLFSFQGWENATFVAGELPPRRHNVLLKGFLLAVVVVGSLYMVVAGIFLEAFSLSDIQANGSNTNYPPLLTGDGTKSRRAWTIVVAISAAGNLNSIIYTYSRVKQAIGQADILPWSKIWKKDHIVNEREGRNTINVSPQGGLLLHWAMTFIIVLTTINVDNTLEAIGVPGTLQTYTHAFIQIVLAALYWRIPIRERALAWTGNAATTSQHKSASRPSHFKGYWAILIGAIYAVYIILNALILGFVPRSDRAVDGSKQAIDSRTYPAALGGMLGFALLYYFLVFGGAARFYPRREPEDGRPSGPPRCEDYTSTDDMKRELSVFSPTSWAGKYLNVLRLAGVWVEIIKDDHYDGPRDDRVRRFGRRWRTRYLMEKTSRHANSGGPGRSRPDGTSESDNDGGGDDEEGHSSRSGKLNFLYWFFGGTRWIRMTPWERITRWRYFPAL